MENGVTSWQFNDLINKRLNDKSIFYQCFILNSLEEKDRQFVYEKSERIEFTRSNDKLSNIIFDKGDAGNYMYVLIDGIVDIIIIDIDGHEKIVHSYNKPGDFFGEQSLLDNLKTRAARAVIASDC